jgi:hypothetical protein
MGGALDEDQKTVSKDTTSMRPLDEATRIALVDAVEAAKVRGWLQPDLRRYFKTKGIELATYAAAKNGQAVDLETFGTFAQISITGLPARPYAPNAEDIRRHIEWLVEPARGAYDDALIEIAYDGEGRGPSQARLFGLDEIDAAVQMAAEHNAAGSNVYIGAALRDPNAPRYKRASGDHFYVATAVPIDIDKDYDATRARMATVCDDGLVVTTGMTPERRSQHWARLVEPCDDDLAFEHAFGSLVSHAGADMKVKDTARIMRLGGTVSYPDGRKVAAGYCTELTSVTINAQARSADVEALKGLTPYEGAGERFDASSRPTGSGVERRGMFGTGVVHNGREAHFRDLLLKHIRQYQAEVGADPDPTELWDRAFAEFSDPEKVDNSDGRWTSVAGQKELHGRLINTIRRLQAGRLARVGLYSIATGAGEEEAKAVQAAREATRAPPPVDDRFPDPEPSPAEEQPAKRGFRLKDWTAAAYAGDAPQIRWLCDGTVPLGIPMLFASMGGLGKSFMALDLGLKIAVDVVSSLSPRPILGGLVVEHGTAVILSAEDSRDSIHRRLEQIDPERRRDRNPDKLIVVPLPDTGGPMSLIGSDGKGGLVMTPAFVEIKRQLAEIEDLKVVVIDPLQAFVMADINADPAAGQFMWSAFAAICAETGATLIAAHHMRKDGAASIKTADEAREAIRGSTALVDGARLTYALWKASGEDGRDMCARLDIEHAPERIAFGAVVKANDQALRTVQTYVRQESGLLVDHSDRLAAAKPNTGVPAHVAKEIVAEIGRAFDEAKQGRGEGFAMHSNTGDRQAWKLIVRRAGCSVGEARTLAEAWVANGILQMQEYNAKGHKTALRLVGRLG